MTVQKAELSFSPHQHPLEPHLAHSCFSTTQSAPNPEGFPTPASFPVASSCSHLAAEHFALRKSRYTKSTPYFQVITTIDRKEKGSERPLIMRGEQN